MEKLQNIAVTAVIVAFIALTLSSTTLSSLNRLDKRVDGLAVAASAPASTSATSATIAPSSASAAPTVPHAATKLANKATALIGAHPFCSQSLIHYESCANQIQSVDALLTSQDATLEHVLNSSLMQGASEAFVLDHKGMVVHAGNLYSHMIGQQFPVTARACQGVAGGACALVTDAFGNITRMATFLDVNELLAEYGIHSSQRSRRGFMSWLSSAFSGGSSTAGSAAVVSGSGQSYSTPPSSSSGVLSMAVTGASAATARGEGFSAPGAATSAAIVQRDQGRLSHYKEQIMSASNKYNVPPEVIGGIISRETHAGGAIGGKWNGYGDGGHAFGLMQVDTRYHTPDTSSVQAHIDQGTSILSNAINAVATKHPDWPRTKQIQGGVAAYNSGPGNIQTQGGIDIGTTHNDYSNDVIARAQALHNDGFFN